MNDATTHSSRRTAAVIVASTRAAGGVYADRSGPVLVTGLTDAGFQVAEPIVVADGPPVEQALRDAVTAGHAVVVTSGGTGIHPNDQTPEMTRRVLDREMPQLAAAIARHGADQGVPTALLSRGVTGTVGTSLIINLPGSTGAARDGLAVLTPLLDHAVDQLLGGDH